VSDAIEDESEPASDKPRDAASADAGTRRALRVDETFAAAGIGAEHPSLYPGRGGSGGDR
jgi:hypothetical protein